MNTPICAPESVLPLSPATYYILLALATGEKHGYSIQKDVAARTKGKVHLGPGTLYGALQRLLEQGLIAPSEDQLVQDPGNERRRCYMLSDFGRRVAIAESRRLAALVDDATATGLLDSKPASPIRSLRNIWIKRKEKQILAATGGGDP